MRINGELVKLRAEAYRERVSLMRHEREMRRCLIELDIAGIRKLWREMAPHLDQPENDAQALQIMHEARVRMQHISPQQKRYSEHWLRELANKATIVPAVGIIVGTLRKSGLGRAADIQAEMGEAVLQAVKDGVSIEHEVAEVHARMGRARERLLRFTSKK